MNVTSNTETGLPDRETPLGQKERRRTPESRAIRRNRCILLLISSGLLGPSPVPAAPFTGAVGTMERPSQRLREKPVLPRGEEEQPVIAAPPVPEAAPPARDAGPPILHLKRVKLEGNTVFSNEELAAITGRYEGKDVSADDLRQLRQDLTLHYIQHGYINSGAVLPEQSVQDGELRIKIVEGRLTDVQIEGLDHLREFYLRPRIARDAQEKPLNVKELQENLQLLQQSQLIKRINAELAPGLKPGEAILRARVEEARPYFLTLGYNNDGVPSVGAEGFEVWAGHRNLFGVGDQFDGNFNLTEGQEQYEFDYALPFTPWDTALKLRYQHSEAHVVEEPFDQLNIFNQSETFGVGVFQPVWKSLENTVTLGVIAERRHSKAFLLDEPFPFSRGADDQGVSNVSVLRFGQDWLNRTENRVIALRSVANWGVDVLDATVHEGGDFVPDGRYFFWLGQAQWIQRLWDTGIEMHLTGNVQLTGDQLLSLEQYALGGMYSVRGYRKNQVVRDSGYATSLEFRIPILKSQMGEGVMHFTPFFDFGGAWNVNFPTDHPHTLASAGLGLHFDPARAWHVEFYWARPIVKVENNGHDLQDSGVHFAVNFSPF